jgi:sigma-B regulation protein RsbU (phosphoserine phosphatase)
VACTVIRSTARLVDDPGECLSRANDMLAANNEQSMFVTVFYGVLCPKTGRLVYADGGHNSPYLVDTAGRVESLPRTKGKLLALFPGRSYASGELTLSPGDALFLFTDGITEAQDVHGALFGDERLEQALANAPAGPQGFMQRVLDRVAEFVGEAPQADDITCLALRWRP